MSIFDNKPIKEQCDELLYQEIKNQLDKLIDKHEWGLAFGDRRFDFVGDKRTAQKAADITLQFVWRKLGMKIPELTRRVLDENFKIMEYKQENKEQ